MSSVPFTPDARFPYTRTYAMLLMVLCALMWSSAGVVVRTLQTTAGFELTFWRSIFTALILPVMLLMMRGTRGLTEVKWFDPVLLLSGVFWGVMFAAFMIALTLTSVADVLVTLAIGPLLTALSIRFFLKSQIRTHTWMAIALAGAGIALIFSAELTQGDVSGTLVAALVPLAAALNWTLVQANSERGHAIDLVPAVLWGAIFSCAVTLPLALPFKASMPDIGALALLGLMQLAVPCVLSILCARILRAPEMSLLSLLEVVFGILWAWLFASEAPASHVMIGGAMVLGAMVLNAALELRSNANSGASTR